RAHFPTTNAITLIERDPGLTEVALEFLPGATTMHADISQIAEFPPHDLVIATWSMSKLPATIAAKLWQAAQIALVIIEPGTPRGAALIRVVRKELLAVNTHMPAPSPAEIPCPLADPDWCPFAARVKRSSLHRRIKN